MAIGMQLWDPLSEPDSLYKKASETSTPISRRMGAMLGQVPWASSFITPILNPGSRGLILSNLSQTMVGQRVKYGSVTNDLFHHLVR